MVTIKGKVYRMPPIQSMSHTLIHMRLLDLGLKGAEVDQAFATMHEWTELPPELTKSEAQHRVLKPVYLKEFESEQDFARAAAGHTLAEQNRVREERLAFAVLEHLKEYEAFVLDPLLDAIVKHAVVKSEWRSYYGPAANLDFSGGFANAVQKISELTELDRLYQKVALLHDYCRNVSNLKTPHRNEHEAMRLGKWSLVESDDLVKSDRKNEVSVWAGTSGSAMDMIFLAKSLKFDADRLTALAWCIAAFFHFMPTVRSPTHTFHEVMRGARKIIGPEMGYDPSVVALPEQDYYTTHLKG